MKLVDYEKRFNSVKKWFERLNFDITQFELIAPEDLNKLYNILYHTEYEEVET